MEINEYINYLKKEKEKEMFINDIQIIINGKCYKVNGATVMNNPGEWPEVDIRAILGPFNIIKTLTTNSVPEIVNVIFNYPATIVFWSDSTKTVVKCDGEEFDPEKAIAMAYMKKYMGNNGSYYNIIRKWIKNGKYYGFKDDTGADIDGEKLTRNSLIDILDTFFGNH